MKKRRTKDERQAPLFWGMTPNQVVGYNLWCARRDRGWTQAQAAEALEPHLGVRWTVAQVSAAERSMDGTRVRQFTADDIVAFAQAFDVPITYFFVPPRPHALWTKVEPSTTKDALNRTMAVMIDLILGDPNEGAARVASHLHDVMSDLDPALFSEAQRRIFELARLRMLGVIRTAIGSLGGWQESLRSLADELGQLELDVAKQLASSLPDVREEDLVAALAHKAKTERP
jgi:transcriptional regulator with XRE-family HTH domain